MSSTNPYRFKILLVNFWSKMTIRTDKKWPFFRKMTKNSIIFEIGKNLVFFRLRTGLNRNKPVWPIVTSMSNLNPVNMIHIYLSYWVIIMSHHVILKGWKCESGTREWLVKRHFFLFKSFTPFFFISFLRTYQLVVPQSVPVRRCSYMYGHVRIRTVLDRLGFCLPFFLGGNVLGMIPHHGKIK